jgi:hypothetical protein
LEQASQRQAPVDEVLALTERYRQRHLGWNVWHMTENCWFADILLPDMIGCSLMH